MLGHAAGWPGGGGRAVQVLSQAGRRVGAVIKPRGTRGGGVGAVMGIDGAGDMGISTGVIRMGTVMGIRGTQPIMGLSGG